MAPRKLAVSKAAANGVTKTSAKPSAKATVPNGIKPAAKKAAASKAAQPTTNGTAKPAKAASTKRKAASESVEPEAPPRAKKAKSAVDEPKPKAAPTKKAAAAPKPAAAKPEPTAKPATKPAPKAVVKDESKPKQKTTTTITPAMEAGPKINSTPADRLDIYVFGEGSAGELGLGSKRINNKKPIDVKRPRLNENLAATSVGVVQIACGGMHAAALTHDSKILTWGVNDQGALGRDTTWDGGLRDADADGSDSESDSDDDTGINPRESNPSAVPSEYFAPKTTFAQVVASDSATFVLTEDGRVYGWGTFRSSEGILGFNETVKIQERPALIPQLKNIKRLAAGSNHVLALDSKGIVYAWGCGQQSQLGRRVIERSKMKSLVPYGMALPKGKIVDIACGSYHSFALDAEGQVWGWGLNNFAETAIEQGAGNDDAVVVRPTKVKNLSKYKITNIAGGEHHSIACTEDGELLAWGRIDSHQTGIPLDKMSEDIAIYDERDKPRILYMPTAVPNVKDVVMVSAGTDNSFAITRDFKAYAWGFSGNYQTGLGTEDDVEIPTVIENSAVKDKKIVFAGAGGQFSVLAGLAQIGQTNGV